MIAGQSVYSLSTETTGLWVRTCDRGARVDCRTHEECLVSVA
jgi:hypothetical protein